jgi:hypothetical protein
MRAQRLCTGCLSCTTGVTDINELSPQQHWIEQLNSLSPVSEGFVEDSWLSILLTLCLILHLGSDWLVLDHLITSVWPLLKCRLRSSNESLHNCTL